MAEDKKNVVTVKARAKAFLTTKPEEEESSVTKMPAKKKSSKSKAGSKAVSKPSAVEIAAAARKAELERKALIAEAEAAEKKENNGKEKITDTPQKENANVKSTKSSIIEKETAKAEPKTKEAAKAEPKAKEAAKAEPKAKEAAKAEPKAKEAAKSSVKKVVTPVTYVQYQNQSYDTDSIMNKAEDIWTLEMKKKVSELKSLAVYIKPEEKKVYCVYNDTETGSFDL